MRTSTKMTGNLEKSDLFQHEPIQFTKGLFISLSEYLAVKLSSSMSYLGPDDNLVLVGSRWNRVPESPVEWQDSVGQCNWAPLPVQFCDGTKVMK